MDPEKIPSLAPQLGAVPGKTEPLVLDAKTGERIKMFIWEDTETFLDSRTALEGLSWGGYQPKHNEYLGKCKTADLSADWLAYKGLFRQYKLQRTLEKGKRGASASDDEGVPEGSVWTPPRTAPHSAPAAYSLTPRELGDLKPALAMPTFGAPEVGTSKLPSLQAVLGPSDQADPSAGDQGTGEQQAEDVRFGLSVCTIFGDATGTRYFEAQDRPHHWIAAGQKAVSPIESYAICEWL